MEDSLNKDKEEYFKLYESKSNNSKCKVSMEFVYNYRTRYFRFCNKKFWREKLKPIPEKDQERVPFSSNNFFNIACICDVPLIDPIIPKSLIKCVNCFKGQFHRRYKNFKENLNLTHIPDYMDEDHIRNIIKLTDDYLNIFHVFESKTFMIVTNLMTYGDPFGIGKYMKKFKKRRVNNIKKALMKLRHKDRHLLFFQSGHLKMEKTYNMWYGLDIRIKPYHQISTNQVKILENQFKLHFPKIRGFLKRSIGFVFSMYLDDSLKRPNEFKETKMKNEKSSLLEKRLDTIAITQKKKFQINLKKICNESMKSQ